VRKAALILAPPDVEKERTWFVEEDFTYKIVDGQRRLVSLPRVLDSDIFTYVSTKQEASNVFFWNFAGELDYSIEPQEEGGFVAYSSLYSGAIGQGETREEALDDLKEAIEILKEVQKEDRRRKTHR
jgi:predicted RNase H-like HicB family nuclease